MKSDHHSMEHDLVVDQLLFDQQTEKTKKLEFLNGELEKNIGKKIIILNKMIEEISNERKA